MKFLYPLAKRFIAGHDFDSAKLKIQKLINEGYEVSVDYIGEKAQTMSECRSAYLEYKKIIKFFQGQKINISIKPSQLGLAIHPYLCFIFMKSLSKSAKEHGHTIRLDMEDSKYTEFTKTLATSLNNEYGNVGVAIQANLFRTQEDLNSLIE